MAEDKSRNIKHAIEAWEDPRADPYIQIQSLTKRYKDAKILDHFSLSIYRGEFFSLLGESGCGKTTLLRVLSGLEMADSGNIIIDNDDVTNIPTYKRPTNMMFQSYALFPHMDVWNNVAFGLKQDNLSKDEIEKRVASCLRLVEMEQYMHRKPDQLSGGQAQRVALARCLAKRPKVVLLDEPLAALDKHLRSRTQFELVNIQESVGITFIMVTHDQGEAMTMSTRIGIMEAGRLRQVGTPSELYEFPNSLYVAQLTGMVNIFEGVITDKTPNEAMVDCDDLECSLRVSHVTAMPVGARVSVVVRPEKIIMSHDSPDHECNWTHGVVDDIAYTGDFSTYHVGLKSGKIVLAAHTNLVRMAERSITWEDSVYLYWRASNSIILTS